MYLMVEYSQSLRTDEAPAIGVHLHVRRRPDQENTLCASVLRSFEGRKSRCVELQIRTAVTPGWDSGDQRGTRNLLGSRPLSRCDCWLPMCVPFVKIHASGRLRFVHFSVCIFYTSIKSLHKIIKEGSGERGVVQEVRVQIKHKTPS